MFGIGETELALILIFAFLIFGPDKLPGMGRTIGRMLRQFREAQEGFTEVVQTEVMDPLNNAMNEPQTEDEKKRSSARRSPNAASAWRASVPPQSRRPRRPQTPRARRTRTPIPTWTPTWMSTRPRLPLARRTRSLPPSPPPLQGALRRCTP